MGRDVTKQTRKLKSNKKKHKKNKATNDKEKKVKKLRFRHDIHYMILVFHSKILNCFMTFCWVYREWILRHRESKRGLKSVARASIRCAMEKYIKFIINQSHLWFSLCCFLNCDHIFIWVIFFSRFSLTFLNFELNFFFVFVSKKKKNFLHQRTTKKYKSEFFTSTKN